MAEQFAPVLPEFQYLPSDAKFMGDPVDYIIFDGYTDFRDGDGTAEDINIILLDVKVVELDLRKVNRQLHKLFNRARFVLKR